MQRGRDISNALLCSHAPCHVPPVHKHHCRLMHHSVLLEQGTRRIEHRLPIYGRRIERPDDGQVRLRLLARRAGLRALVVCK